jgi:hypothetical protein
LVQEENVRRKQADLKRKAAEAAAEAAAKGGGKRQKGWWEAPQEGDKAGSDEEDVEWYRKEVGACTEAGCSRHGLRHMLAVSQPDLTFAVS